MHSVESCELGPKFSAGAVFSQRAVTLATTWSSLRTSTSVAGWYGPGCSLAGGILPPDTGGQMLGTAGGIQQDGLGEGGWERRDDTQTGWAGRWEPTGRAS